ncbi:DoxX family protein [Halomarina pelagica]|uniref:DoxX family protein n=1 Tax=Halomarina pelagica TaxID=2961599 RepID=UPI0020C29083|nr:DoxX family protein [Halomarina sp. BND7]
MEPEQSLESDQNRTLAKSTRDPPSLLSRILIGGALGYTALKNFRQLDGQIAYAESKGVPYAEMLVPFSSGLLAIGSLGVILWRVPIVATGAIASFLLGVTPIMHDFWNEDDEQQRQVEMYQFVKNVVILGAIIEFLYQGIKQR